MWNHPLGPFALPVAVSVSVAYVHMAASFAFRTGARSGARAGSRTGFGTRSRNLGEILAIERGDVLPAVIGGCHPIGRPVDGEERVAGVVVAVKLMLLAQVGQHL